MTKQEIRKQKILERKNLSYEFRTEASSTIATKLFNTPEFQNARIVHIYKSLEFEVSTIEIIDKCYELGKKVVVPVTNSDCSENKHFEIFPQTVFGKQSFGVLIPIENCKKFDLSEMSIDDLFVIPLVSFDSENNRIGYGKGCYDSFLASAKGPKFGIAFNCQKVELIDVEDHDARLDGVICELK
jgi:5-formyltetrahydrofolate cyclo-ligase